MHKDGAHGIQNTKKHQTDQHTQVVHYFVLQPSCFTHPASARKFYTHFMHTCARRTCNRQARYYTHMHQHVQALVCMMLASIFLSRTRILAATQCCVPTLAWNVHARLHCQNLGKAPAAGLQLLHFRGGLIEAVDFQPAPDH